MGSFVVRASHVGVSDRTRTPYPGPATDEEMEIAKRAARYSKISKSSTKKKRKKGKVGKNLSTKQPTKISFYKKSKSDDDSAPTPTNSIPARDTARPLSEQERLALAEQAKRNTLTRQAKKLGISEQEMMRRINALKRWHTEQN